MAKNNISTLATKAERQLAKLQLAETKRQQVGTIGYRALRYLDITELPTVYAPGDNNTKHVIDNPNTGGLVIGRPWKSAPNILTGLWRSVYDSGNFDGDWTWFDSHTPSSESAVTNFNVDDISADNMSIQWLGYFRAPLTANYIFWLDSDDKSQLWIADKAITLYSDQNADVYTDSVQGPTASDPISLVAGQYYPIRVQWGNGNGNAYINMSWETDATIEQTGLVVLLNAALGWNGSGDGTWVNVGRNPMFNGDSLNPPAFDYTTGVTAMSFNGGNYFDVNNPTSGDFTLGVWFNTTSTAGTGTHFYDNPNIVGSDSAGIANDWGLCMRNGQIGFGARLQTIFTTQTFNDGHWHYVVVTRVQTTGAMTIFVDGVQLATIPEALGIVLDATDKIRIASDPTNGTDWRGLISEVQFYQLALTPVQIASNFNIERAVHGV